MLKVNLEFQFVFLIVELSINKSLATKKSWSEEVTCKKHLLELRFSGQGQKPWGGVRTLSGESGHFQSTHTMDCERAGYLF